MTTKLPFSRRVAIVAAVIALLFVALPATSTSAQASETFSIVVIPDTQLYLDANSPQPESAEFFRSMTQWIADNADAENVVFTTHVGDVTQDQNSPSEWALADEILSTLEDANVPYGIAAGNHDINAGTEPGLFDENFGPDRFEANDWYAGYHPASGNRASFQLITVEGQQLLFMHIRHLWPRYGDPTDMLAWVTETLEAHPAHLAFITTHEFTNDDGTPMYPELEAAIQDSCNVVAMFSGHRTTAGASRGTLTDSCDRTVHHMMTNYQILESGGDGFMRRLDIDAATLTASSTVFSPVVEGERTSDAEKFTETLAAPNRSFGDVDDSGVLDDADAQAILDRLVGLDPAPFDLRVADVDGDGVIGVADALRVAG